MCIVARVRARDSLSRIAAALLRILSSHAHSHRLDRARARAAGIIGHLWETRGRYSKDEVKRENKRRPSNCCVRPGATSGYARERDTVRLIVDIN